MYCKNCGRELNEEHFCPSCGTENITRQQYAGNYAEERYLSADTNNTYGQNQKLVCPHCGKKFQNPEELRQTIKRSRIVSKIVLWMDIVLSLLIFVLGMVCLGDTGSGFLLTLCIITVLSITIAWYACVVDLKKKEKELNEIEEGLRKYAN